MRMTGQKGHKLFAAELVEFGRIGMNYHAFGHDCTTGTRHVCSSLDIDHAESTSLVLQVGTFVLEALIVPVNNLCRF